MTVYAIVQLEITDRETYDRYTANFWDVFKHYNGTIVVNQKYPEVLEGEWPKDKMVVLSFPDRDAFMAWATSPEYLEIAKDRIAGANATIVLAQGFEPAAS